jgi:N-acylneuraminate cytidylyltransferase
MLGGKRVLAVITGRGGSKGLPRKNVLEVGGRPMVAWSVLAAKASRYLDRVVLSSDDPEIIAAAGEAGCDVPFVRPPELATDDASIADVVLHALDTVGESFDIVVLLQATSPLRSAADIDGTLEMLERSGAPACLTVTPPAKPPYWMVRVAADGRMSRVVEPPGPADRRQQLPAVYAFNGAVYAVRVDEFRLHRSFNGPGTLAYVMPPERSVDVDTRMDLLLARALMAGDDAP